MAIDISDRIEEDMQLRKRQLVCTLALDLLKATAGCIFVQTRDVNDFFEAAEEYYRLRTEYLDDQKPEDTK